MPVYQFRCRTCNRTVEHFSTVGELELLEQRVQCCGAQMDYDWTRSVRHKPFRAFTTKNVTGQPMEIDSMARLRQVEREHGVNFPAYGGTMMPDVDIGMPEGHWIDDEGHKHKD